MRVKKFQARDMAEAMRMVKTELGANAIILHSRDMSRGLLGWFSRGGVEVTAGVDPRKSSSGSKFQSNPTPNQNPDARSPRRGGNLDIKIVDDQPVFNDLPPLNAPASQFNNAKNDNPLLNTPMQKADNPLLALSKRIVEENNNSKNPSVFTSSPLNKQLPADNGKFAGEEKILDKRLSDMEKRLIKLTGLIENLGPSLISGEKPSIPSHTRELYNHLLDQDVDEHLALNIASTIAETTDDEDDVWTSLKAHLISRIKTTAPIELCQPGGKPKVVMLVGPTGVGKTTTLAKISAQYRYNPTSKTRPKIVFITADLYRLAAVEQLQKYTEILGVELEVTYSPDEVRQALKKHKDAHLILFDTAGTCQRNMPQMSTLGAIVDACHPDEVHLVMSATTKYSDMIDIVEHFKDIKPTRLLFTKIDESTTYGPIFNTITKFNMPISYLTTGQNVPEDIEKAKSDRIAKLLLTKPAINRSIHDNLESNDIDEKTPVKESDVKNQSQKSNKSTDKTSKPNVTKTKQDKSDESKNS